MTPALQQIRNLSHRWKKEHDLRVLMQKRCAAIFHIDSAAFDCCVLCGSLTNVPHSLQIEYRSTYVEGVGQLCLKCYQRLYA